jgi:hypothetical protein
LKKININMKKIIVLFVAIVTSTISFSQITNWEIGIMLGGSNYVGDINSMFNKGDNSSEWNQFESSFNFYNIHFMGGLTARYNFNPRWAVSGNILFSKLSGDDSHFKNERNLNFHSMISEASVLCEFNFLDYRTGTKQHRFTPYIFGGLALFHFNPKTEIIDPIEQEEVTVNLHDLNTEGEGMEGKGSNYHLWQIAVPFGIGVKFSLSQYICIGAQWGFRKTFTDYIDDISTTYVDRTALLSYAGEQAAMAADRTNEINAGVYHKDGEMRGNSSTKDWYNFFGLTITTKISSGNNKCLKLSH